MLSKLIDRVTKVNNEPVYEDWSLLKRWDIGDFLNPEDIYLTRWFLAKTPHVGVYLHQIHRADSDRHLHNHPRKLTTLILKGGYVETMPGGDPFSESDNRLQKVWNPGTVHSIDLHEFHAISKLLDGPTWSLVLVGPSVQGWGYATPKGIVPHKEYEDFHNRQKLDLK